MQNAASEEIAFRFRVTFASPQNDPIHYTLSSCLFRSSFILLATSAITTLASRLFRTAAPIGNALTETVHNILLHNFNLIVGFFFQQERK
jgi:hypothetical protein